jgi:hypothetical protein
MGQRFASRRLNLNITGGEPFLDRVNIASLLQLLSEAPWVESVKVDTNISWKGIQPRPRVSLDVSYHPEHVSEDKFFEQLQDKLDAGWTVDVVRYVVLPDRIPMLRHLADRCLSHGVPMCAISAYGSLQYYTPEETAEFRKYIPEEDWFFRTGGDPNGGLCSYPGLGFDMYPDGSMSTACHPHLKGSLFGPAPESVPDPVPCPQHRCSCEDMYSHLLELPRYSVHPVDEFAARTRRRISLRVV